VREAWAKRENPFGPVIKGFEFFKGNGPAAIRDPTSFLQIESVEAQSLTAPQRCRTAKNTCTPGVNANVRQSDHLALIQFLSFGIGFQAARLQHQYAKVCADKLPGYGDSGCSAADDANIGGNCSSVVEVGEIPYH